MHYSFDIFDTCLIRTCGFSHNVFDILALRTLGVDSSESLRADFVNSRITAEARARKRKKERLPYKKSMMSLTSLY